MFPTLEVRWFLPGRVPAEVEAWFQQAGSGLEPAVHRMDRYLILAGQEALGIKVREGRLEVKERQSDGQVVQLHERVAGRLEHWRKYGFVLAQGDGELAQSLAASSPWISVDKARLLRRYRLTGSGSVVPIPPIEYPERACDWELTEVRTEGKIWWTVCFEAFGQEPQLEQTLRTVVAQVLAAGMPITLKAGDSFGYPQWLAMLNHHQS